MTIDGNIQTLISLETQYFITLLAEKIYLIIGLGPEFTIYKKESGIGEFGIISENHYVDDPSLMPGFTDSFATKDSWLCVGVIASFHRAGL